MDQRSVKQAFSENKAAQKISQWKLLVKYLWMYGKYTECTDYYDKPS